MVVEAVHTVSAEMAMEGALGPKHETGVTVLEARHVEARGSNYQLVNTRTHLLATSGLEVQLGAYPQAGPGDDPRIGPGCEEKAECCEDLEDD